jgi:hypothetical protein
MATHSTKLGRRKWRIGIGGRRREEEKLRTGREGVALKIKMHRAVQLSIAQS